MSAGLLCVRQVDHAALAGRLAEAWGEGAFPPHRPRESVVRAARRHDDGWGPLDDDGPDLDPDSGTPHDYRSQPLADRLAVATRSVEAVAAEDPYAAWLVSRHFASFHAGGTDPAAVDWTLQQVGRRATLLARARPRVERDDLHPHALEANLDRLQLLDALSLALCEGWVSWDGDVAAGYGEERTTVRYRARETGDDATRGTVEPWPFADPEVAATVPARRLPDPRPETPADLARAWSEAAGVRLEVALDRG